MESFPLTENLIVTTSFNIYYNPMTISSYHVTESKHCKRFDSPGYNKTFPPSLVLVTVLVELKDTFNEVQHLGLHVF